MKRVEQRSSFITIAINNANSTAVVAGVSRDVDRGLQGLGLQGPDSKVRAGAWEGLSPGRVGDCRDSIGLRDRQRSKACC